MKALKLIGLVLLAAIVLLAIAAAVAASRFDSAWAKQKLTQTVQEQKQRTLRIDGDLALSFFPSVGVKLGKATLSERNSPQEFASIDNARVSVRLLPLLGKQVIVDHVELDGARARIVRHKDGSFNFDDLTARAPEEKAPVTTKQGTPVTFDIAGVDITKSAVQFQDEKTGQSIQLSDMSAKTGRLAQAGSGPMEVVLRADSARPRLGATISLVGNYRYDLAQKQYAVDKLDLKVKGDVASVDQLDATLRAKSVGVGGPQGGVQVEALALTAKGHVAQGALEANVDVPRLALLNARASGEAANASVRLNGAKQQLAAKLTLSAIEGAAADWKIGKLDAQWNLTQGALTTTGSATGALHGRADAIQLDGLVARFNLKQGTLAADGQLAGPVTVDLKGQVLNLPKLSGELQVAGPQLPVKQLKMPVDASLHADWGKSQAVGSVNTRVEDSTVQTKFQVAKFSPLAASFDVNVDRLNVDRYMEKPTTAPAPAAPATSAARPASSEPAPIDFSFLRGLNLNGNLKIGALQARNLKLSNFATKLVVANGRLDLNPLSANLYGGSVGGSLMAQADGNRVAVKQTMNNVAIGPLIKDYAHKDILDGRGTIVLDVTTGGNSVAAARQSLNGTARMALRDGAVKGINLAKTLRQGKALLAGGQKDAMVTADTAEQTDFSELAASFRITNGIARNDDLSAKSPFLRAAGAGSIDLVHEQIDYVAKVTVVNSSKGQQGKELADLNGLTVPVRLTGPLDHPAWHVDLGAVATDLAKQQVQKQVEQQLQKQLGNKDLGNVLKGLIR